MKYSYVDITKYSSSKMVLIFYFSCNYNFLLGLLMRHQPNKEERMALTEICIKVACVAVSSFPSMQRDKKNMRAGKQNIDIR